MNKQVVLKINGQEIPLNPFVQDVFKNVIGGLVTSLDKIPADIHRIEVELNNNREEVV